MDYNHEQQRAWKIIVVDIYLTQSRNNFDSHKPNLYLLYINIINLRDFRMSSIPKKMGKDDSTTNLVHSGPCIFNSYKNKSFKPFVEYNTEEDVE